MKACIAVNPETDIKRLFPFAEEADMLLVMSVHPGYGGQKFIEESLEKIEKLKNYCIDHGLSDRSIEVDGGVSAENAQSVIAAGADVLVAGSAVFRAPDMAEMIGRLKSKQAD